MDQETERAARPLESMYRSGTLSDGATDALLTVTKGVERVAAGLGDRSSADELLLATILVDDSASIAININEIRFGHKLMLDALRAEAFAANVQVHTRALNRGVLSPYSDLSSTPSLTEQNYSGSRLANTTPLYLQSLLTLGTVMVKAQEEEEHGVKVRTFTLIITDGEDNSSGAISAIHVRYLVKDMLEFSANHIVAGMGVGERTDFRQIFRSMGIPECWIFTPGTSMDELRAVFRKIAQSLCLAASSEAEFLQLAAGPSPD